jgi:hypothetical protein
VLDQRIVGQRYFFPRATPPPDPFVVRAGDVDLVCHRALAGHPRTLLHFHGNGEVVDDWVGDFSRAVNDAGLDLVLAEYRGYGGSDGEPALAAMLDDALAVADAVGKPAEQLVVYGRSVGSLYALHVAANRPVAGLVIESGIADVHERLRMRIEPSELGTDEDGLRAAVMKHFDHRAKLEAYSGPVLVLHARGDHLVDVTHGERLASWAGQGATLRVFERGDHNTIHAYNGPEIVGLVGEFA